MWITDHWLLLVLLAAYSAVMVHHARVGNRETGGLTDYFVGGRRLGGIALGVSFFATYASTNTYLGFSGKSYSYGLPWLLIIVFAVGMSLLSWVVVAPRLRVFTERVGSITLPDFIGFRFASPAARLISALIVVFASLIYMTAVYKGIGNLLEVVLDLPYVASISLVLVIVMLYTAVGGFHSVVRTDVVQGGLMIAAAALISFGALRAAGGLSAVAKLSTDPSTEHLFTANAGLPLSLLVGVIFATTVKFLVEPRQLSRFYALADERATRKGMWVSTLSLLFVFTLLTPIGLIAHRLIPSGLEDTDRVVPILLTQSGIFGPAAQAFLFVAILSAAMSSLDSVLLVTASTFERDLLGALRPQLEELGALRRTRMAVVAFAILTAILALRPPAGIVELTSFSGALYGACFLPTVILGLHWRRGSGTAVISSFVAGITVLAGWRFVPLSATVHAVFPAVLLSFAAYGVLAWRTEPADTELAREIADISGPGSRA